MRSLLTQKARLTTSNDSFVSGSQDLIAVQEILRRRTPAKVKSGERASQHIDNAMIYHIRQIN